MPTENQNTRLYKLYYVLTVIYPPLVLCVKTTLLSILARIFTLYQTQVVGVYSIFAIFVIYYTIIFFIKVFICSPISCFWTEFNNNIHCLNKGAVIIADAVMSVTSDMVILLLPLALTMPLNLPRPKKLKAALMLGCGGLAIGFSIYRLILVIHEKEIISSPSVFMRVLLSGSVGLKKNKISIIPIVDFDLIETLK
ncbi:hypothetical protein N7520_000039 [Penicillium odoratum]|uniref:uncharacterized protein n=1 Tax=Penicillium odoratum TaxID=1167516 RepID=UPI0025474259|nr:uncharacterized protein N7520_000039 [Penicillium odoratum]KAJ5776793.1 hypothetical protein N7520_000039 [Penicillium odoratum]